MSPERFQSIRIAAGLSQRALAKRLHLSPKSGDRYIRMIEKSFREPSPRLVAMMEQLAAGTLP